MKGVIAAVLIIAIILIAGLVYFTPKNEVPKNEADYSIYDVNMDGKVNQADADLVSLHYGEHAPVGQLPGWIREDVNLDGVVNYLDVSAVINHIDKYATT
jgi:hypothetical protein